MMVTKGSRGNDSQTGLGMAIASVVAAPPTGLSPMGGAAGGLHVRVRQAPLYFASWRLSEP